MVHTLLVLHLCFVKTFFYYRMYFDADTCSFLIWCNTSQEMSTVLSLLATSGPERMKKWQ